MTSHRHRSPRNMMIARALASLMLASCSTGTWFQCEDADDCASNRAAGVCQPSGFCSFPADDCASQQRYGERAPPEIAGSCVPDDGEASTGFASSEGATLASDGGATSAGADESTSTNAVTVASDESSMPPGTSDGAEPSDSSGAASTGAVTGCGDGFVDESESCDGSDLTGLSCSDLAFPGGTLACDPITCELDVSACNGCGEPLTPSAPGPCPMECTSCAADMCNIVCDTDSACEGEVLTCPDGWNCTVTCSAYESCREAEIRGPSVDALTVDCQGIGACHDAQIECGHGMCDLACGDYDAVCSGADQWCGEQACSASCIGGMEEEDEGLAHTHCGASCSCVEC